MDIESITNSYLHKQGQKEDQYERWYHGRQDELKEDYRLYLFDKGEDVPLVGPIPEELWKDYSKWLSEEYQKHQEAI